MSQVLRSVMLLLGVFAVGLGAHADDEYEDRGVGAGKVVIANRASGTISVIDVRTNEVRGTYTLPIGDALPEPMYVVHAAKADRVFVGDRANNRVVIFDDEDFEVEGFVPTGRGVFHMWADPGERQLWVNNDIDNTATVIDPVTLEVLATVPMPADLVAQGGKPHDVILDPSGAFAYVTMLGFAGDADYLVKFSTRRFREVARAPVGKDPHVSLTPRNKLIYVPTQNSDAVFILKRRDLSLVKTLAIDGAHGAGMARNGKTFYTTNLPGGGQDGLFAIDTRRNTVIGQAVDVPFAVPHNIALTPNNKLLYVTHSGASADKVTIYRIDRKTRLPVFIKDVTVGLNPFGLSFVH